MNEAEVGAWKATERLLRTLEVERRVKKQADWMKYDLTGQEFTVENGSHMATTDLHDALSNEIERKKRREVPLLSSGDG
eukprot:scaffold1736_cov127-Cylindrotheca_fusiformis.AAC.53